MLRRSREASALTRGARRRPVLSDDARGKHYALGRGDYVVSGVSVASTGAAPVTDRAFTGGAFTVGASTAVLVPVLYDQRYFSQITGFTGTPAEYMAQAYSRPNQVFTPSSAADPDGAGRYREFPMGFDEMMNVRHLFRLFPGYAPRADTLTAWCESAGAYARTALGLTAVWTGQGTRPDHHGFDYLIGLTPDMGGGVACGWLDIQVSSFINRDIDRQQVIAVHESGHIFGAPHCDDVGDGSGGGLQGYVMCAGEKHPRYPGQFVWHSTSTAVMRPHWD
jgi:hypothetical protein